MRDAFPTLKERGVEVLAVAPADSEEAAGFFRRLQIPFPCLSDPDRTVFRAYGVESALLSLGQRPAVFVISPGGEIVQAWRGHQQWEIPPVSVILDALDRLHNNELEIPNDVA